MYLPRQFGTFKDNPLDVPVIVQQIQLDAASSSVQAHGKLQLSARVLDPNDVPDLLSRLAHHSVREDERELVRQTVRVDGPAGEEGKCYLRNIACVS